MRFLLCSVFLIFLCLSAKGQVTPEELSETFGTPPEVVWSPTVGTWWYATGAAGGRVAVGGASAYSTHTLTATVTGPGVMRFNWNTFLFGGVTAVVKVDGVQSGYQVEGAIEPWHRVQVGPGTHTLTWEIKTSSIGISATVCSFSSMVWMPVSPLPLQEAAGSAGVTLSGNWQGQSLWHDGDGTAAWSGIITAGNPGFGKLKAAIAGPGILRFRASARGGDGAFQLDGGLTYHPLGKDSGWRSGIVLVGEGSHEAEWWGGYASSSWGERRDGDLLVDNIRLLQEVDIATALDTPGRQWTVSAGSKRTFGYPDEEAAGGSAVFTNGGSISTQVAEGDLVSFLALGGEPSCKMNGISLQAGFSYDGKVTKEGTWNRYGYRAPAAGEITISGTAGTHLDEVRVTPPPADISVALGFAQGSVTTGGDAQWQPVAMGDNLSYGGQIEFTNEARTGWMDLPVIGPAEIRMDLPASNKSGSINDGRLLVSMDGRKVWYFDGKWESDRRVTIEIPPGPHTLRIHAQGNGWTDAQTINGSILKPLPDTGKVSTALDLEQPWVITGTWELSAAPTHDGVDALRPAGMATEVRKIRMPITGPGYLSFRTYIAETDADYYARPQLGLNYPFLRNEQTLNASHHTGGWREQVIWYPPGDHWMEWIVKGGAEHASAIGIDSVSFTPTSATGLAEGLGAPALEWDNDEALPWNGVVRDGAPLAVSPILSAGESSRFSTQVSGPGVLAFKWKKAGSTRATGTLWINGVKTSQETVAEDLQPVMILMEGTGVSTVEWVATGVGAGGGWLEVSDVFWSPWVEKPLGEALGTPPSVTWTTSPEKPFEGRPQPGAANGTAARVMLAPGEESWIEATVDGPGLFDFQIKGAPGSIYLGTVPYFVESRLFVDGEEVNLRHLPMYSADYPSQWIDGPGPHQVRLLLRNPEYTGVTVALALDEVKWTALAPGELDTDWSASSPSAARTYPRGGKDDEAQIVLHHPNRGETTWMERVVTGPALVQWDSVHTTDTWIQDFASVSLDGVAVEVTYDYYVPSFELNWIRRRLSIPAGTHVLRWTLRTEPVAEGQPARDLSTVMRISGLTVTPGITPLQEAMDDFSNAWLEMGQGNIVTGTAAHDGEDSWRSSEYIHAHVLNLSGKGMRTKWWSRNEGTAWNLSETWIPKGGSGYLSGRELDSFTAELVPQVSLSVAMDLPEGIIGESPWAGIAVPEESHDGVDVAWSVLRTNGTAHGLTMPVRGPARVRFRWKHTGMGELAVHETWSSSNWQRVSVEPAGPSWSEVEVMIDEGDHELFWFHGSDGNTTPDTPSEAWVDQVVVTPLPARTLAETAVEGGSLLLSSTPPPSGDLTSNWNPAFYLTPSGSWKEGVRSRSGEFTMQATVTGPGVLMFRGRCTQWGGAGSVSDDEPEFGFPLTPCSPLEGDYLSVRVGSEERVRMQNVGWKPAAIHIPAGTHVVSWQVMESSFSSGSLEVKPTENYVEGWVDDISFVSPREHFDHWTDALEISSDAQAPQDDADGDGVSNLLEYAFSTDPNDGGSKPGGIGSWLESSSGGNSLRMVLPYVAPFVDAEVYGSGDLVTWTPESVFPRSLHPGGRYEAYQDGSLPPETLDNHTLILPFVPETVGSRFYRLEIRLPD